MQCASSTTSSPADAVSSGSTASRKSGLFSRSGLTRRTSTSPAATASCTACHSSWLAELIVAACTPARSAASIWLRISASSGETITVGPSPSSRSSAVATKYTADLPHPVRCTTSARLRLATSASIAVHWSRRSRASWPARARSRSSASSRSAFSSTRPCLPHAGRVAPNHVERMDRSPRERYRMCHSLHDVLDGSGDTRQRRRRDRTRQLDAAASGGSPNRPTAGHRPNAGWPRSSPLPGAGAGPEGMPMSPRGRGNPGCAGGGCPAPPPEGMSRPEAAGIVRRCPAGNSKPRRASWAAATRLGSVTTPTTADLAAASTADSANGTEGGAGAARGALREQVLTAARRARAAASQLVVTTREHKDAALRTMAEALRARTDEVLAANKADVEAGRAAGLSEALLDRLALSANRVDGVAGGLLTVAGLADPVGEVLRGGILPNGLELRQVRVPLGVIGIVYEARPNVTVDAAGLALEAGNAVLLRGSSSAERSNAALVTVLRDALKASGLPADAVQLLPCHDRASVQDLITARGLVDLVIPRGGAGLISTVVEQATVPTVETGVGNCHVYVDGAADLEVAERIVLNSKARRPSVCNAAETLLVHADVATTFVPRITRALADAGVTVHADDRFAALARSADVPEGTVVPVGDEDWDAEYLSLDIAAKLV